CLRSSLFARCGSLRAPHPFPTRRSSDLAGGAPGGGGVPGSGATGGDVDPGTGGSGGDPLGTGGMTSGGGGGSGDDPIVCPSTARSEEHTSELQSRENLVCRLLLEKKK